MKNRIRIKDIADKAGVSTGTVDRVLHKRGNVAADVLEKVEKVMEELGFERNLLASALAYNRVFKIVALLPDYKMDPYWSKPYLGVQKAFNDYKHYGFQIETVFFNLFDPRDFLEKGKKVLALKPDGLILPPVFFKEGKELLDRCAQIALPTVIFNTYIEHPHILSYIGQDSFQSGVLAARLLNFALRNGEPALLLNLEKGATNASHLLEKERGFNYYFANHPHKDITVLKANFEDFDNKSNLRAYLYNLFESTEKIGGIFVTNSRAYKIIECLEADVLAKLVIVGYDLIDNNIGHLYSNKINFLINQNPEEQGYLSITSLFKALFLKENPPLLQHLPLDIVVAENIKYYLNRQEQFVAAV